MDRKFLTAVQLAGWTIASVEEDHVIGRCPNSGCGLVAKLSQDAHVPVVDPTRRRPVLDKTVVDYDDLRTYLRARREDLCLSIRDVEEIAGLECDHLAKMEKDDPARLPNLQMVLYWANAVGMDIVLRPMLMPPIALTAIADTRDKVEQRRQRNKLEGRRRRKVESGRKGSP